MDFGQPTPGDNRAAAPRFAEAYPRLDFLAAQRAVGEGRTICVFELNGAGRVGHFDVLGYVRDEPEAWPVMKGGCDIFAAWLRRRVRAEVTFLLSPTPIGVNHFRDYVLCPSCLNRKGVLVFVADWKCRQCHGLLMRSQVIDPRLRLVEKRLVLWDKVGRGRPKGMHNATYQALLGQLEQLEKRVDSLRLDSTLVTAVEHDRIVTARWMTRTQDRAWLEFPGQLPTYRTEDG